MNNGYFDSQLVPVTIPQRKGDPIVVDADEHPRYTKTENGYQLATSMERLGKLRAVFREGGSVTAGNASGLNDGSCALVLMSAAKAEELGINRWPAGSAQPRRGRPARHGDWADQRHAKGAGPGRPVG